MMLVGRGGLEPPTSRLSGVRSNHLSYRPSMKAKALGWTLGGRQNARRTRHFYIFKK